MANIGTLTARLGLETRDFDRAADQARNRIAAFANKATQGFSGLTSALGGTSTILGALAATGAVAFLRSATESALESEKAWNDLGASIQRHGGDWAGLRSEVESFATTMQRSTSISDEAIARSVQQFVDYGASLQEAYSRVKVASDLAIGANMSLESATELLTKASVGYTSTLSRYGIIIDENIPKSKKFAAAIDQINERFSGAATSRMATHAGQIALLAQQYDDLKEKIGGFLLVGIGPAIISLNRLFDLVNTGRPIAANFAVTTADLAAAMRRKAGAIDEVNVAIDEYVRKIQELNGGVRDEQKAFEEARAWVEEFRKGVDAGAAPAVDSVGLAMARLADATAPVAERTRAIVGSLENFPELDPNKSAKDFKNNLKDAADSMDKLSDATKKFFDRWDRIIEERAFAREDLAIEMKELQRQATREGGFGPSNQELVEGRVEQLNEELGLLQDILSQETMTRESAITNAKRYRQVMFELIAIEEKRLKNLGIPEETIAAITTKRVQDVMKESDAIIRDSLTGLRGWVVDLSADLNAAFENTFFDVMKGRFEKWYQYLEAITDVFLRDISRKMADSLLSANGTSPVGNWLVNLLGIGGGGGAVGTSNVGGPSIPVPTPMPDDISGFATGGLVMRPTLAMVGEAGPELIVPLSKMNNGQFLSSLGDGWRERGGAAGEAPTIINFQITTPDPGAFKASQSQIMSQAAVVLGRARRNL